MKLNYLLLPFLFLASCCFSQQSRPVLPSNLHNYCQPLVKVTGSGNSPFEKYDNKLVEYSWPPDITIGLTYGDKQSRRSSPAGRVVIFNDNTLAVIWSLLNDTIAYSDRGTGYSYFDGNEWTMSTGSRIESIPTTSPSIGMLGEGEVIISAKSIGNSLHMCSRAVKGTGDWMESELPLPNSAIGQVAPRVVTGGRGHSNIHVLSLTTPVSEGGEYFHGQDGALVYQRSTDGGLNWDIIGATPDDIDSSHYNGFSPDTYALAEPNGSKLAFVVGDPWSDLFIMKSDDNGNSWQKTIVWQHPYPNWNGDVTDTLYCPDGSVHIAYDESGTIHIVFGITRLYCNGSIVYRFPFTGGIGHWKEGMPTWTDGNQLNCLNPDSLEMNGGLACNFLVDWNGNGVLDILGNYDDYDVGPVSFPQIAFDQYGVGMLIMSAVTEGYNNTVQDYRHIWYKYLFQGQVGNIVFDYNKQPEHMFRECVYPSLGARSPDNIGWPFIYEFDSLPGLAMAGDLDPFSQNYINKADLKYMLPPPSVTVTVVPDPVEGGTVQGGCVVGNGSMVTIEAHAKPGWEFVNWTSQNVQFSTDSIYAFEAVWNYYLLAHFRLKVGIEDVDPMDIISIMPNPANSVLNMEFPSEMTGHKVTIYLVDRLGMLIRSSEDIVQHKISMDISNLSPGLYLLWIHASKGKKVVKKLVKV